MACAIAKGEHFDVIPVSLFITTYAEDFFSERELLRKEIQPELETWGNVNNVKLEVHHVKWGSKHPDKRPPSELQGVQSKIEDCYYNNVMPLFLNFTRVYLEGEVSSCQSDYPDKLLYKETKTLKNGIYESLGWVPTWGDYHDRFIESYLKTYGLTSLDLEVMYGAYREDNLNSLFLYRCDDFLDSLPHEEKSAFPQKMSKSDQLASESCNKIHQRFPPDRIIKYKPVYKGLAGKRKRPKLHFNDSLKELIVEFVKMRVLQDYLGQPCHKGAYYDRMTRQLHESFMYKKSERVMGREAIVNKIEEYVMKEERDVPLILVGGAGCGKSSVLCRAASVINAKASDDFKSSCGRKWHVYYHFVGAVPGSTTVEVMLKRLLREMDVANDSNMPKDLDATAQMCCSMLSNPNTRPLIMFVDALNQFVDDQAARVLSWLPRKLAPQVRIIFSSIENSQQHETLLKRETKPIEIHIAPLDVESRKDMVKNLLKADADVMLSDHQLSELMNTESSENPLWLSVACEELKHVDPMDIDQKIKELPDGLLNLLERVLSRFERTSSGNLVTATLCLLEASSAGLLESELRQILGNKSTLMPPSPFDEKEEKESSEKESNKQCQHLPEEEWQSIYSILKPFLRPYGDSKEGRIDFYHRAVSKAVRKLYFEPGETEFDKGHSYYWWHKKLADFFEVTPNIDRMIEEYPYQLVCLDDTYRLSKCLCDWRLFDVLYHEEYSSMLLSLWRKVGPSNVMVGFYEKALSGFEESENVMEELVSIRYEKVCRVVIQAGKNHEALELLKTAMKIEEKELGARNHRMVELYALMAEIYDEKLKLNDFVSPSQLPDLRKAISYGKKAIALRKKLSGRYHKFKLGMSLMKLAFNMESWEACGGSTEMSGSEALAEGNRCIDMALKIFQELNDIGHYAEALMTKGVLAPRGSMEQLKLYNQAMDLCMQMYGEYHILTSRLYINIGIVYEDNKEYRKAYEYFKKWARVSEEILGPDHPKTRRAKGVLQETRYRRIAQELDEWDYERLDNDDGDMLDDDDDDDEIENPDFEHYYDDAITHLTEHRSGSTYNGNVLDNNCVSLVESVEGLEEEENQAGHFESNSDDDDDEENFETPVNNIFVNRLVPRPEYPSDLEESDREHSDNENFFDDNCEDYDEQYTLLVDHIPPIEEFNTHQRDEDNDYDVVNLATIDYLDDNRYADDTDQDTDVNDSDNVFSEGSASNNPTESTR